MAVNYIEKLMFVLISSISVLNAASTREFYITATTPSESRENVERQQINWPKVNVLQTSEASDVTDSLIQPSKLYGEKSFPSPEGLDTLRLSAPARTRRSSSSDFPARTPINGLGPHIGIESPSSKHHNFIPPEVTDLTITVVTSTSIALSWSTPDTECNVTGYNVSYYGKVLWGEGNWVNGSCSVNSSEESYVITNLIPYTEYTITVVASTAEGPGRPSVALNGILGDYLITWDDGSGDNQLAEVNTTSFLIKNLIPCVLYNITVKAQTGAGYGEKSYIDATTNSDVPPEVTDLNSTNVASTSIALSWSTPDTKCDITGYNVTYYGKILWRDGSWVNGSRSVNGSQEYVEIDGLTPYTQYTITVVASTVEGPGMPSEHLTITTAEAYPSEVRNLMANSTSPTEIFVSWEVPKEENGILGDYLITWDDGSGDNQSAEVNTTSFLIEGLIPCVLYNITVKAQTGAGYGEESYIDATPDSDVPPEVTDLIDTNVTSTSIALSWSTPDTECDITGYNVSYYGKLLWGNGSWVNGSCSVNSSEESYVITDLIPYTEYTITVVASTAEGPGRPSEPLVTRTLEAQPSEIRNLMANSTSPTEIFVSWKVPGEENGILGDYLITWDDGSGDNQLAEVNTTSFLIDELVPCVLYNITVKAQTGAGYGEGSYTHAMTGSEVHPEVTDLWCPSVSSTRILLSWSRPNTACVITNYSVSYYGEILWGNHSWVNGSVPVNGDKEYVVIDGLTPYTQYTITVVAWSKERPGSYSEQLRCRTYQASPSEPGIKPYQARHKTLEIFWSEPEILNGILLWYHIILSQDDTIVAREKASSTQDQCVFDDLRYETSYNVTVEAWTGGGMNSSSVVATTASSAAPVTFALCYPIFCTALVLSIILHNT
ncbi:phosphatidylinositol phosphatase PTPRQ [Hyalella azteca]|uniref:Phosphatidylinositol phosphatase PTPRQ n=1 Tax=Hyalella azteca TaxID=294128 RepID=A0A979FYK3_HYAAZ|nr:phosphatidylinositol phosphatase PTPRQ [Hyalella azteca]